MIRNPKPSQNQRTRFLPPSSFLDERGQARAQAVEGIKATGSSRKQGVLLMSAARDDQYSYDTEFNGRPNGAFTYFALQTLRNFPATASYHEWLQQIQGFLPDARWPQEPDLDGHPEQLEWLVFNTGSVRNGLTEQDLLERLKRAYPGQMVDLSDFDPRVVETLLQQVAESNRRQFLARPRDGEFFDLGPHVDVKVNMWWGPFGEVKIQFDRVAVDNYDRAITFVNLVAVGVPVPVAGIVAGVIRIMVAVASENGLIVWVQVPSLIHTPLPA
jgi:hypothetical protein